MKSNEEVKALLSNITDLENKIKTAKTNLKKQYYKKKLDKEIAKTLKSLTFNVLENPELLKPLEQEDETVEESFSNE